MRMRLGLVVGFGTGYYLGAKAGRPRYDELNRGIAKVRRSDAYRTANLKTRALVDLGVERARAVTGDRSPAPADASPPPGRSAGANGAGSPLGIPIFPSGDR